MSLRAEFSSEPAAWPGAVIDAPGRPTSRSSARPTPPTAARKNLPARPRPVSIRPEAVRIEGDSSTSSEEDHVSKVVVFTSLTLDGVMQAPGRPDEDRRGGFEHGGWAQPYNDPVMASQTGNPFTEVLDNTLRYVASTTLKEPLPWSNSALLEGDAAEAVARLKQEPGKDMVVLGSGELVQSLRRRNLVDAKTTTTGVVIATYRKEG
jgi:dihydrofolate reductase